MKVDPDHWLTEVLGLAVFRVTLPAPSSSTGVVTHQLGGRIFQSGRAQAFYYAKVPTTQVGLVRALCAEGFAVVDVNVTFESKPVADPHTLPPDCVVRSAGPSDAEAVQAIASNCFIYSRFHLDPLFSKEQADRVKFEWVRSYCAGRRGERLLVAEIQGQPAGFLAILAAMAHDRPCRVIDLVGVAPAFQRRGVGRALVSQFMSSYLGVCDLLRVGTQVANIPSTRLYEQCGFQLADSAYVLHAHVRGGRVVT